MHTTLNHQIIRLEDKSKTKTVLLTLGIEIERFIIALLLLVINCVQLSFYSCHRGLNQGIIAGEQQVIATVTAGVKKQNLNKTKKQKFAW